jgi:hypothetical protein
MALEQKMNYNAAHHRFSWSITADRAGRVLAGPIPRNPDRAFTQRKNRWRRDGWKTALIIK